MKNIEKKIIAFSSILFKSPMPRVIYYHDIVEDGKGDIYTSTDLSVFTEHMRLLSEAGARTLLFSELGDGFSPVTPGKKDVLVCFDDGYESNYKLAYEAAKKYGVKINIFLIGKSIKEHDEGFLSEAQITEMLESGYVDIGAHTWGHVDSTKIGEAEFDEQIIKTNEYLSTLRKKPIDDYCMPYGYYDDKFIALMAKKAPYKRLYTSDCKCHKRLNERVSLMGRAGIENEDSAAVFKAKASGKFNAYYYFKKLRGGSN